MSYLSKLKVTTAVNIAITISFLAAAVAVIVVTGSYQRRQAIHDAQQRAKLLADYSLAIHRFYRTDLKPALFKKNRDKDSFEPVWMSTAYAVRQIIGYMDDGNGDYYYKECAINARSSKNEADAAERLFIEEMNRNPGLESRSTIREIEGRPYLEVLRRGETMERRCFKCHSLSGKAPAGLVKLYGAARGFNRQEGEIVSAMCIRIPLGAAYSAANRLTWELAGMLLLVLLALLYVQFRINHHLLVLPFAALRHKATEIAGDEKHLGDEIDCRIGREFIDVADAFNSMSKELRRRSNWLEERFLFFMENMPGIAFIKDREGRYVYANKTWQRSAFGESPGEWLNKTDLDVWPREIARQFMENDAKVFASGQVLLTEEYDGSPRNWLSTKFPIMDESGKATLLGGISVDVTKQKRLERYLLEEKTFNEVIVNSMPGIFYLYDRQGRFIRWNQNAEIVTGYSAEELAVAHPLDLFPDDEKEAVAREIETVFSEGSANIEGHLRTREGKLIPYLFVGSSITLAGTSYLVGTGIDLTQRIEAEQILKESHERLRNLSVHLETARENERKAIAREVHDDLGQLLTAMRYDLSWLKKHLPALGDPRYQRHIDSIDSTVDEAVKSVQKVCAQLRPKLLDDLGLKAAIEWQFSNFAGRAGIHCRYQMCDIPASLSAESSIAVLRIIQESFTNILRHADATEMSLNLVKNRTELMLTIADNGRGITHEQLQAATSYGLMGMRERAASCGGILEITGAGGKGTLLQLKMPLKGDSLAQSIDS